MHALLGTLPGRAIVIGLAIKLSVFVISLAVGCVATIKSEIAEIAEHG